MTFIEALKAAIDNHKMIRRKRWPDGVVCSVNEKGYLEFYHVAATSIDAPPAKDFLQEDWLVVENYGKDISYDWR